MPLPPLITRVCEPTVPVTDVILPALIVVFPSYVLLPWTETTRLLIVKLCVPPVNV